MLTSTPISDCVFGRVRPAESSGSRWIRGFTLVELLVVLAIVGILAGILIPVIAGVRERSRTAACASNLRQIGIGFRVYLADNKRLGLKSYISSGSEYWYRSLLGSATSSAAVDSNTLPACPSADATGSHAAAGGYGMTNFVLWYPAPAHRVDSDSHFFSAHLQRPQDWPLFMDADTPIIYGLDNPVESAASSSRFAARHGAKANVLMVDLHLEAVGYGDTRWSQSTLNSGSYYTP